MTALINIKRLALLTWALVNAALGLAIGSELGWGEALHLTLPTPVVQPAVAVEIALPPDYRLPEREKTYAVTLKRPLFVPSRSEAPPVPPPPPPPPPSMKKGQFQLLGTTITDEMQAAIVKEVASGKVRQIMLNQTINGLLLKQVEPDRVVFTQYDDREELRLKIQPSLKAPPAGQPGSAPAAGKAAPVVAPQETTLPVTRPRDIRRGSRIPVPSGDAANL
jgi:hypothetical protein